jgi:hypothetical protein
MTNRVKFMILVGLFWIVLQIILLSVGFPSGPVLMCILFGISVSNLIGMCLDIYNEKVNEWFDSTDFFLKNKL